MTDAAIPDASSADPQASVAPDGEDLAAESTTIPLLAPRDGVPPVIETPHALRAAAAALAAGTGPVAIDAERRQGKPAREAIHQAALLRFRPILMTTLAMVFGMVPLAFALSEGSEQRAPMGQAVIGGVITSSLLTLVVVPVIYCWRDDLGTWCTRRLFGGGHADRRQPAAIPPK